MEHVFSRLKNVFIFPPIQVRSLDTDVGAVLFHCSSPDQKVHHPRTTPMVLYLPVYVCAWRKSSHHPPVGLLQLLPVPVWPYQLLTRSSSSVYTLALLESFHDHSGHWSGINTMVWLGVLSIFKGWCNSVTQSFVNQKNIDRSIN